MKYKHVFFDFDGTLVDSMPVFSGKMLEIFRENNLPITDDTVKIITPLGYRGTAEYAISLGMDSTVEEYSGHLKIVMLIVGAAAVAYLIYKGYKK